MTLARRGSGVELVIDDAAFQAYMRRAADHLGLVDEAMTLALLHDANDASEARGVTWHKKVGGVEADQWWAHFLAHGTVAHGANQRDRLFFMIDDEFVSPVQVRGIAPDRFDDRAVMRTRSRMDEIIELALREA